MANAELPFFHPAGDGKANRRDDGASDPAIAAAFAAFHRRNTRRRFSYLATSARFLRGSGGLVLGLTAVAVAGSLFLARVPTSAPDHAVTIGGFAPEMIYKRPATAENALVAERDGAAAAQDDSAVALMHAAADQSFDEAAARLSNRDVPEPEDEQSITATPLAQNSLPAPTANYAAAMRLNALGVTQSGGSATDIITSGFAAEELPTVPEPAAGPTVAIGLAALLGLQRFGRRRRNNP